jgi:hypothetical protein
MSRRGQNREFFEQDMICWGMCSEFIVNPQPLDKEQENVLLIE